MMLLKMLILMAASFAQQMQASIGRIKMSYRQVIENAFIMLVNSMLELTPVGNPALWKRPAPPGYEPGRLVNNYFSSLVSPLIGVRRAQDIGGGGSLKQALSIAKQLPGTIGYIVNPTPYAKRIEFAGWSSQAPAGMVRISAAQWPRFVRAAAKAA